MKDSRRGTSAKPVTLASVFCRDGHSYRSYSCRGPMRRRKHLSGSHGTNAQTCFSTCADTDAAAKHTTCHHPRKGKETEKEKEGGLRGNLTQVGEGEGREGMGGEGGAELALGQVPCIPQTDRIQLHST